MCKVNSVTNQKGGPGKTTITRNLGEEVSERNQRVLLIDNDPQGNLTSSFFGDDLPESILVVKESLTTDKLKISPGISNTFFMYEKDEIPEPYEINENLFIIGATKHLAETTTKPTEYIFDFQDKIEVLSEHFDHIFIDCPPAAGILQTSAQAASDFIIIPTVLSQDSINGVKEQMQSVEATRRQINNKLRVLGVVVNCKDSHKIKIEDYHFDSLTEVYPNEVFDSVITSSVKVSEARSFNKSVRQHAPNSVQAKQFLDLTSEYLEKVGG